MCCLSMSICRFLYLFSLGRLASFTLSFYIHAISCHKRWEVSDLFKIQVDPAASFCFEIVSLCYPRDETFSRLQCSSCVHRSCPLRIRSFHMLAVGLPFCQWGCSSPSHIRWLPCCLIVITSFACAFSFFSTFNMR